MVGYRHYFDATCAYATGCLRLAILEALKESYHVSNAPGQENSYLQQKLEFTSLNTMLHSQSEMGDH